MSLKKQIDQYVRDSMGKSNAIIKSINWYNTALRKTLDKNVQRITLSEKFDQGKLYRFRYTTTAERLKYYDRNPLVISLGRSKFKKLSCETCLNLNLLPYDVKTNFMEVLYNTYEKRLLVNKEARGLTVENAKRQAPLSFSRKSIMKLIKYFNAEYAVRNYIDINRSTTSVISYENWYRAIFIEEFDFHNFTITDVYNDYFAYIKHKKQKTK